jgi:1-acyl-sn-glycerol-3-phosphate acyltransferase
VSELAENNETGQTPDAGILTATPAQFRAVIAAFLQELHPAGFRSAELSLDSRIERDLGIDSLSRTELTLRIERAFRARLPISAMNEAETVGDLLRALQEAQPRDGRARRRTRATTPSSSPVPAADEARTLLEILDWHAARHADRLHATVLQDDETVLGSLTYGELHSRARSLAEGLLSRGIEPGDRVALMLPTSIAFFIGFMGILHAAAIPVPIYPPTRLSQIEDHMRRQAGILRNAGARLLLTVPEGRRLAGILRHQVDTLDSVESVDDLSVNAVSLPLPPPPRPDDVALIQYTSGSTGDPKGVVLSHANLLANIRAMATALDASATDVFVSWLPLYHDMGLIGAWLGCLHHAAMFYVMAPTSFLARPENWLWAIHRYRGTLSASPNFGFELCLNKIDDAELQGLDLSSIRMMANGSEPVSADTVRRFNERFGRFGFRADAMAPVYGLAECAVGLAFPPLGRPPLINRVDREALTRDCVARSARPDDPKAIEIVACGQALSGHEIRIVDDRGRELNDRREGRLEFRGPSATSGYFRDDEKTKQLFHDGWLDSGDRAYVANGEIYITGRVKDVIIRGGHNIYPQELEEEIAAIPGVRKGGVAVFGSIDRASGTEQLVVLAETTESDRAARAKLQARITNVATDVVGTPPEQIVLAPPRTVPKTSSGKIRRSAAKALFEAGRIGAKPTGVRWQITRLTLSGSAGEARRIARILADRLYAIWWWTDVGACYFLGWAAAMILPRLAWRWAAARLFARTAFRGMGVPLSIEGVENLPRRNAVLVFNHSSYVDALLVAAFVPGEPVFVAKKELAPQRLAGPFLRRLGTAFVDRYEIGTSIADTEAISGLARQGRVLVFFPEGSFTRRPGLSEFYLGAFKIAAEAGKPVIPGILHGTRAMMRSDQWFPRRTPIGITIGDPITPGGTDFAAILRLREAARAFILAGCGEPDLRELVKPEPPPAWAQ